ncbi:MAG: STAS domain-containing protein [bacterium]
MTLTGFPLPFDPHGFAPPPEAGSDGLQITIESRPHYSLVVLRGDLNAHSAEALRLRLLAAVEESSTGRMVLDLSRSPYIDSAGLGSVVAAYKRCLQLAGTEATMVILHPSPEVRELFRLTQLDSYLRVYDTVEEARMRHPWMGQKDP